MTTTLKLTTALTALFALAACGGSGGGGNSALLDDPSFGELAAAIESAADDIGLDDEDELIEPASPDDLLVPGSATYTGQVAVLLGDSIEDESLDEVTDSDILGQVELDVAFTSSGGTLSGTMLDFVGSDGEDYSGVVDIAEADLLVAPTIVGVASTVSGSITDEDGVVSDVTGGFEGAFTEGDTFFGLTGGQISNELGSEDFFGVIIASD